ncbi:Zn-ribbon domain-containing OB-fold protein [Dactylosporangium sp. CA-233914]|uniref:Zn-ribbon domain-containing OB-fold protein n=1 Tax=Dactylosporangium sp. CA-233914 TaxID=3239934 RepID=UPI003D8E6A9D
MTATTRPVPSPSDWSAPFWSAARQKRLVYQVCGQCGAATLYAKRICPNCLADALSWRDASGQGEVYTYTQQVAGAPSGFADLVPYVIAVVRLDEGVQLMSNIVGPEASSVQCGDRVTADFYTVPGTDMVLPVFTLDRAHVSA